MSAAAVLAAPTLTQHRVATLRAWARAGMDRVGRLRSHSGRGLIDAGPTLLRVAQAVRLALVLALRLADPDNPLYWPVPAKARAARAAEVERPEPPESGERPKRPERPECLRAEPVSDAVILRRPLVEIVRVICKALGVTPDLSLWSDTEAPPPAPASEPTPRAVPPGALPEPPPRRRLVLERRVAASSAAQRARLRRTVAPLALIPCVDPARGRFRLVEAGALA